MTKRPLYREIASTLQAYQNCIASNNLEWRDKHKEKLEKFAKDGPSGCGIDCGTKIDFDHSKPDRLVFLCSFHHMNETGMYDGWTEHTIIITPSLPHEYNLRVTGRDRNDIKDYLADTYNYWLAQEVEIS